MCEHNAMFFKPLAILRSVLVGQEFSLGFKICFPKKCHTEMARFPFKSFSFNE